jgi:DNA-directed RNA polymerase subunit RPC12/RpoP
MKIDTTNQKMKVPKTKVSEIIGKLEKLYKKETFRCVNCGRPLPFRIQDAWDNQENAWLYIECEVCHYQNAVWKILYQQFPLIFYEMTNPFKDENY